MRGLPRWFLDAHIPLYTYLCFLLPPLPTCDSYMIYFVNKSLQYYLSHNACNTLKNYWIRKIRLIWKSIPSQPGKQTIAIHILPNISRSKGKQAMKFGQWKEYKMKNTFLKKSYTKYGGKTIPRPFCEKPKFRTSLDHWRLYRLLLLYAKLRDIEIKLFKEQKEV